MGRDGVLGFEANREPCDLQHRQVVGAVAHGHGVFGREPVRLTERRERVVFGPLDERPLGVARERPVLHEEFVGDDGVYLDLVTRERCLHALREATSQDGGRVACVVQSLDDLGGADAERHLFEGRGGLVVGQPLKQRRPLVEALGVGEFPAHRPSGDVSDLLGHPVALAKQDQHL